jgi:sulfatase maturation enzyme AslB (radical SAM superfamily)
VNYGTGRPGLRIIQLLAAWKSILGGSTPMLSIEITRECPLRCPGCYAYGDAHLGGSVTLRSLADHRGQGLVDGIIRLVGQHRPLHVSLVGGEPLVRHRELTQLLPILGRMRVHTMIVTSAVIPIPKNWMEIPRVRVAVSVDGLPEHHNVRRHPATYDRVLANIVGCQVNIHGTFTHPMLQRAGYIEEYVSFWSSRPEVVRIWVSTYTPQREERSEEILTVADRERLVQELLSAKTRYPKLLMNAGIAKAMLHPPSSPSDCMFSRMSVNYTADLKTRVEPCVFGGTPDCSQCGCAASTGLHWLKNVRLPLGVKIETVARSSMAIGALASHFNSPGHIAAQARPR